MCFIKFILKVHHIKAVSFNRKKTATVFLIFKINFTFLLLKEYAVFLPQVRHSLMKAELGRAFGSWTWGSICLE